ncbi:MAG: SusC/RagA family TonB-linked outer membrane protein [Bacteroidaceae bacterium]|nr:SusC/RagA family TonB-linked outer membrane protein [Bacteroidaceae bacterium]
MGKRILFFLACAFMTASMALAQKRVTGTVTDSETGEPIPGASVKVQGTTQGTLTDIDGKFTLGNVPNGSKTLIISFMGMKTAEVPISPSMNVILIPDVKAMDEVMVVAYGQQKKSSFTGSASILDASEIGKVQVINPIDALKGKASGVQIYNPSGQPGSVPSIRIRGFNSLIAGMSPLIVLDGSPFDGTMNDINPTDIESMTVLKDAASTALYGARGGNGVILITTKSGKKNRDAEISVDMKWGSNMKASRNYDVISSPAGYYETYYEGLKNYATNQLGKNATAAWQWANDNLIDRTGGFGLGYNVYNLANGQALIGQNGRLNPAATLGNVVIGRDGNPYTLIPDNWNDETYHHGLRQQYTVNANGSTEKGSYYTSVDYLNTDGITDVSNYERFTGMLKADYMLKKWLKVTENVSYSHYNRDYLDNSSNNGEGTNSSGNLFALQYLAPIYPVYMRDGQGNRIYNQTTKMVDYDYGDATSGLGIARPYMGQSNPLSDILVDTRSQTGNTLNGTGTIDLYLPYGFTVTSINNVYFREYRYTNVQNPYFGQYRTQNGTTTQEDYKRLSNNFQQRINWQQSYGLHNIEATVAHEYYRTREYDLYGQKHNMFSQKNKELDGAVVLDQTGSEMVEYNTESWLARAMYNYDERYYVHGSVMRQASSIFHPDHRWGTFWSASAGWMINKESFFNADWVDMLKLKVSYGENGNDNSLNGWYYTNRYDITNSNNTVSLVPRTLGKNEKLSWEKNTKFNVGVDFALFGERLSGTIEYYNNHSNDLISSVPNAPSYGYTSSYANVGNMRNHGIEIEVRGDIIRTKDFTWSAYANMATNSNKITELAESRKTQDMDGHMGYSSEGYFYTEGMSRYTMFGRKFAGIYNSETWNKTDETAYDPSKDGLAMYYKNKYVTDANGDVVKNADGTKKVESIYATTSYSAADDFIWGDALPDVYGGFGTSVEAKGFDLSVDFQYQLGGTVNDSGYAGLMNFNAGYGFHKDILNYWSPSNPNSNLPRLNAGDTYYSADRFLTSARFLSLNNITFGYTLPKDLLRKAGFKKIRVYAVADNVYLWSARKGLDPRQNLMGDSNPRYYSPIRSISGGVQLSF